MKTNLSLWVVCLAFTTLVNAQNLKVSYETELTPSQKAKIKSQIPFYLRGIISTDKLKTYSHTLYSNGESLWEGEEKQNSSGSVEIQSSKSDYTYYRNRSTHKFLEQKTFLSRKFLISDSLKTPDWQITKEKKEIAGYNCQKAVLYTSTDTITAWFTDKIAISEGPENYFGLPGLIIQLRTAKQIFQATKIEFPKSITLTKPTKGKKITLEEFKKLEKEKKANQPKHKTVIIKTENE